MSRRRKNGPPGPSPEPRRYEVSLTRRARQGLDRLSVGDFRGVDAKLRALAEDPRPAGVKKLEGPDAVYRIRSGSFRILYLIEDARLVVLVVDVGDRRDVYRGL